MTRLTKAQKKFLQDLYGEPHLVLERYVPGYKLVELGLATFEKKPFDRKLYTITPKGVMVFRRFRHGT